MMTNEEIQRIAEEHKLALDRLLYVLDQMPPINCEPCVIEEAFGIEPTIALDSHRIGNGKG